MVLGVEVKHIIVSFFAAVVLLLGAAGWIFWSPLALNPHNFSSADLKIFRGVVRAESLQPIRAYWKMPDDTIYVHTGEPLQQPGDCGQYYVLKNITNNWRIVYQGNWVTLSSNSYIGPNEVFDKIIDPYFKGEFKVRYLPEFSTLAKTSFYSH